MSILIAILTDLIVMTYIFIICFAAFAIAMYILAMLIALANEAANNGGFIKGVVKRPIAAIRAAHKATVETRMRSLLATV